jgi:hypothetical protein
MSIETQIVTLVKANTSLASIIGGRLYPDIAPETTEYPCIVYEVTTGEVNLSMDGPDAYSQALLTLTVYARRDANGRAQVISIRDLLRTQLHGYRLNNPTPPAKRIQGIFYEPGASGYDETMKLYLESLDFEIHYEQ